MAVAVSNPIDNHGSTETVIVAYASFSAELLWKQNALLLHGLEFPVADEYPIFEGVTGNKIIRLRQPCRKEFSTDVITLRCRHDNLSGR